MEKVKGGWMDFDQAIATPDLWRTSANSAKFWGPVD